MIGAKEGSRLGAADKGLSQGSQPAPNLGPDATPRRYAIGWMAWIPIGDRRLGFNIIRYLLLTLRTRAHWDWVADPLCHSAFQRYKLECRNSLCRRLGWAAFHSPLHRSCKSPNLGSWFPRASLGSCTGLYSDMWEAWSLEGGCI